MGSVPRSRCPEECYVHDGTVYYQVNPQDYFNLLEGKLCQPPKRQDYYDQVQVKQDQSCDFCCRDCESNRLDGHGALSFLQQAATTVPEKQEPGVEKQLSTFIQTGVEKQLQSQMPGVCRRSLAGLHG